MEFQADNTQLEEILDALRGVPVLTAYANNLVVNGLRMTDHRPLAGRNNS